MSTDKENIELNRYDLLFPIGSGSFSTVYRVKDKNTGEYYAAKVCNFMVDEETKDYEETQLLFREINLMSMLNHPSVLNFIGYCSENFEKDPCPTIITEFATNGTLEKIIESESLGLSPKEWDATKKLISIYGIASGMSYLHSHEIIHRDLKPDNILMDDFLYPKISDFGLSKILDFLSVSMNFQSQKGLKGTPLYMAPEVFNNEYSKAGDVYAFAFIVFQILTCETPFENMPFQVIFNKVVLKGVRPQIKEDVPKVYCDLIERCWMQSADERPSFDEIVNELRQNKEFMTDIRCDENEFLDYVDFIDNCKASFDKSKQLIHFQDFISNHGRNKFVKKVSINQQNEENSATKLNDQKAEEKIHSNPPPKNEPIITASSSKLQEKEESNEPQKIKEEEENKLQKVKEEDSNEPRKVKEEDSNEPRKAKEEDSNEPRKAKEGNDISQDYMTNLMKESENDPEKQFLVGKYFIEGTNGFPSNIFNGKIYINRSADNNCLDAIIYLIRMLFKGDVISRNVERAKKLLQSIDRIDDSRVYLVKGIISKKENKMKLAQQFYEKANSMGNTESMYKYAKLIFLKEISRKKYKDSIDCFSQSASHGYLKSSEFLRANTKLSSLKKFKELPPITQYLFISAVIKNSMKNNRQEEFDFNEIKINSEKTEILFFNNSFKSSNFLTILKSFKNISIEIQFSSKSFKLIFELINKIKNKIIKNVEIGLCILDTDVMQFHKYNLQNVTCFRIDKSIEIIKNSCFEKCTLLTRVSIPPTVTEIGNNAFYGCSSLTEILIPSSVTHINESAFYACTSLIKISIPSSVIEIRSDAFYGCTSLTEISIPSSVTKIGSSAFNGCTSLAQITIPSSLKGIEFSVFYECSSLTHISIPSSVTKIGIDAFNGCSSLKQIAIPSSVTLIESTAFSGCSSLIEITIPSSITEIKYSTFARCSSLTQISIPSSVIKIDNFAFSRCSSLKQISIPSSVTIIGSNAFNGCASLKQISIPSSVTKIGNEAFIGCSSLTQISIPSSVTEIGYSAFEGCSSLTEITIPSSVTSIGWRAFMNCSSLTEITIPSSVTIINNFVFIGCSSLIEISIPSSVTGIENSAFEGCSSLTQISIPSSVTKIGDFAFKGCSSLTEITIPSSVASIDEGIFAACLKLTKLIIHKDENKVSDQKMFDYINDQFLVSKLDKYVILIFARNNSDIVTIPPFIKRIGDSVFEGWSSMTQISIPSSVTEIGRRAFMGCSSLTQISIPSQVTTIGEYTFSGCSSLRQISLPSSVKHIGSSSFSECSSLTQISLPSSISILGGSIFEGCSSLTEISIPCSVHEIPYNIFAKCSSLKKITIPSSVTCINGSAFEGCTSLTEIEIPSSVTKIDNSAFNGCVNLKKVTMPDSLKPIAKIVFTQKNISFSFHNNKK